MAESKATYVMVDELVGKDADVLEQIIVEAEAIKASALAELERQVEVRRSVLAKARGGSVAPEGKKRGRKPKQAIVEDDETPEELPDDSDDEESHGVSALS